MATTLAPEYFVAIKGKSKGHVTSPVRTQFGFHLIKIIDVKKFSDINKDLYKKIIYDNKRDNLMDKHFANLRSKANIKINL
jgi:parvulin-like peptidyl-prolyl isomerase